MLEIQKAHCPYCGEPIDLVIDPSVPQQEYIEDCFVCCRPITVSVDTTGLEYGEQVQINLRSENE